MTIAEFIRIVETYGSKSSRWPMSARDDCLAFLESSPKARTLTDQHEELEKLMNQIVAPVFPTLESRILRQSLPEQRKSNFDQLLEWLLPANSFSKQIWRPTMVACLPLFFGIIIGNYFSFGIDLESDDFTYWEDEFTMLSLSDYTESSL